MADTAEFVDFDQYAMLTHAIFAASSLADLYIAITSYEEWHAQNSKFDDRVDAMRPDWRKLPKFGGTEPRDDEDPLFRPMSWDADCVLIHDISGDWTIRRRD